MKYRLLIVLFSFLVIFSGGSLAAKAKPVVEEENKGSASKGVLLTQAEEVDAVDAETVSFDSEEDALAYIRECLKTRQKEIHVDFLSDTVYENIGLDVLDKAMAHNGVPTEGDSLSGALESYLYSGLFSMEGDLRRYTVHYSSINYLSNYDQEQELNAAVHALLEELNVYDASDFEKIEKVYVYMTYNISYSYEGDNLAHTAYSALINHHCVCQGYALLFYRLMLELGVDCRYIVGETDDDPAECHAWNIVKLGDYYYNMDVTWGAPLYLGKYRYFLINEDEFFPHAPFEEYMTEEFRSTYPISPESYPCFAKMITQPEDYYHIDEEYIYLHGDIYGKCNTQWERFNEETGLWESVGLSHPDMRTQTIRFLPADYQDGKKYRLVATDYSGNCLMISNVATIYLTEYYSAVSWDWSNDYTSCVVTLQSRFGNSFQREADWIERTEVTASCSEEGGTKITAYLTLRWSYSGSVLLNPVPKLPHTLGEPSYEWNGLESVTASVTCSVCEELTTETVQTQYEIVTPATCEKDGTCVYRAVFESSLFETQEKTDVLPAFGHRLYNWNLIWREDYTAFVRLDCSNCGESFEYECTVTSENTEDPWCDEYGYIRHYAVCECNGRTYSDSTGELISPLGHLWEVSWDWEEDCSDCYAVFHCQRDQSHEARVHASIDIGLAPSGGILYTAHTDYDDVYYYDSRIVKSTSPVDPVDPVAPVDPVDPVDPAEPPVSRVYGNTRYQTSLQAALLLKQKLGGSLFQNVVITTGTGFADALSGSYLANLLNAPVLLIQSGSYAANVQKFIRQHLRSDGTIFILGGEQAVPDKWLGDLAQNGYNIERISGSTRYSTNIAILKKVNYSGGKILVCNGNSFADSLSASAVDLPILLVDGKGKLNAAQKKYLASLAAPEFIIVGGTGAVSASLEAELSAYGTVGKRLAGSTRYATSALIAKEFFTSPDQAVLAYGENYPDGLSGGALAYVLRGPLLLVDSTDKKSSAAVKYCTGLSIRSGYVLGGGKLVQDSNVRKIFGLPNDCSIEKWTQQ